MAAFFRIATHMFATWDKTQTPESSKTDNRIDQPTQPCGVSMKQPSDKIKLEKPPKAPIQCADNDQEKSDNI